MLPVRLHTLPSCDVSASAESANLTLVALGDFEATNESAEILPLDRAGAALRFPSATLALEARIDQAPGFWGYGERNDNGLDVLLWPKQATCLVFRPDGSQGYPGKRGGQALGYAARSRTLMAAGGNDALVSDAIVGALTLDVATGAVTLFDASQDAVLRHARAFASVTQLGDKLLVAGGENPVFGVPEADVEPRATAELFDPKLARFVGEPIELSTSRTRHAAVTLPNGDTLLIGGRTRSGTVTVAQQLVDLVSAETLRATRRATLAPRIDPRAVVLDDGRIFVGGGSFEGHAVEPSCEWLSSDLQDVQQADCIPPFFERAFVATAGGGVLAVGGCEDREATSKEEALECRRCPRGCPPARGYDAYWIDANREVTPVTLPPDIDAARPILLPGSDGGPWLVAADQAGSPRLLRFNPWSRAFSFVTATGEGRLPRPDFPQPVAIDPDTFVWLDDDGEHGELLGMRLGTRNRFSQDVALVLQADPDDPTRPLHLIPDRPLRGAEKYDGKLWLVPGVPDGGVTVSVADADYGDVTIAVHLAAPDAAQGIPESAPPLVLLGDAVLGATCPWPDGSDRGGDFDVPTVRRQGARAELRYRGESRACVVPEGRLRLALRAGEEPSVIRELDVKRAAP